MNFMRKENLSLFLRWVLEAVFVAGILFLIFLNHLLASYYLWYFGGFNMFYKSMAILLYIAGLDGLVIIRLLIGLFNDIHRQNPFVIKNANRLKYIAICCFVACAAFLIHCFMYPSVFRAMVTFVIFIAALACLVVSQLFQQAVGYKSENDLTV